MISLLLQILEKQIKYTKILCMSLSARIRLASKQKITEMPEKEKLDVEMQSAGLQYRNPPTPKVIGTVCSMQC